MQVVVFFFSRFSRFSRIVLFFTLWLAFVRYDNVFDMEGSE